MNCQYPHKSLNDDESFRAGRSRAKPTPESRKRDRNAKRSRAHMFEDFAVPASTTTVCPRLTINPDGDLVLLDSEHVLSSAAVIIGQNNQTLPVPLFPPTNLSCGTDPIASNVLKPYQRNQKILFNCLNHECQLIMRNNKELSMKDIITGWKKRGKKKEKLGSLESLAWIEHKYNHGCESLAESYVGGNLEKICFNDKVFLIHTTMAKESAGPEIQHALCLTDVTEHDATNRALVKVGQKNTQEHGQIYQIAVSRQGHHPDEEEALFATRGLNATKLWRVLPDETNGDRPVLTALHEKTDNSSIVKSVDLNRIIRGEFCELRPGELTVTRNGNLIWRKKLENEYQQCLYEGYQPMQLFLVSGRTVTMLDTRRSALQPLFSLSNQMLQTFWNLPAEEHILSFSVGSRQYISYMATESNVLVWDHRFGSRPLVRASHLLPRHPHWMSTVCVGADQEWLFLESQFPNAAGMLSLRWCNEPYTSSPSSTTFSAAAISVQPTFRKTSSTTLRHVQESKGWGLDWSIQKRFEQPITGLTCHLIKDNTINIWNCTAAGDIFVQQLALDEREIGPSQTSSSNFADRMKEWLSGAEESESSAFTPMASEIHQCSYVRQKMVKALNKEDCNPQDNGSQSTDPIPPELIQTVQCDLKQVNDERSLRYLRLWDQESPINITGEPVEPPCSQPYVPPVVLPAYMDNVEVDDFDDDTSNLISSTPMDAANGIRRLVPSTPLISGSQPFRASAPYSTPLFHHLMSSTPLTNLKSSQPPAPKPAKERDNRWDF